MNTKLRPLLAAVIGLSLAVPGIAPADHYGHGHKYKHSHKKHHRHDSRHYGGHGFHGKPIRHYYKRDNSHEKLLIGLLVGGIAGYAISSAQKRYTYAQPPQAYTYPQRYQPQPAAYPANTVQYSSIACLQEREYQTTVVVGGQNVPAYGTACLQPDGSWRHGRAQPVPY